MMDQKVEKILTELEQRRGMSFSLDRMRQALKDLGNPDEKVRAIHVGGTNGKGSTVALLSSIFHEAGYRVGRYTSPHLVSVRERVALDQKIIEEEFFSDLVLSLFAWMGKKEIPLTYFEFLTLLAFVAFVERRVDLAIIEVGLGGRLDATNVCLPIISILTSVGLEHREYLGDTLEKIAMEKMGILKPSVPYVCGFTQEKIRDLVRKQALSLECQGLFLEEDFNVSGSSGCWDYFGLSTAYPRLEIGLRGDYQAKNVACALAACELMAGQYPVDENALRKGVTQATWPGRFDVRRRDPLVVLDGAHNDHGIAALIRSLELEPDFPREWIYVMSIMKDKDYTKMLSLLGEGKIIYVELPMERCLKFRELLEAVPPTIQSRLELAVSLEEALTAACAWGADPKKGVCVTGSLYLVGEVIKYFDKVPS